MSSFTDLMLEEGYDNPEDFMRYLEGLNNVDFPDIDIQEDYLYSNEIPFNVTKEEAYEYYIFPKDKYYNKVIIKSIGTIDLHRNFEKKYCTSDKFSLGFHTFNYFDYHEASISFFKRSINKIEQAHLIRILAGEKNALEEANEYYKNLLFKHDSPNWKCNWKGIEILEMNEMLFQVDCYSIYEGKFNKVFDRKRYTLFAENHQIEIYTKYDLISLGSTDWKTTFEKIIKSFRKSKNFK